jgi:hypothetical protein
MDLKKFLDCGLRQRLPYMNKNCMFICNWLISNYALK